MQVPLLSTIIVLNCASYAIAATVMSASNSSRPTVSSTPLYSSVNAFPDIHCNGEANGADLQHSSCVDALHQIPDDPTLRKVSERFFDSGTFLATPYRFISG